MEILESYLLVIILLAQCEIEFRVLIIVILWLERYVHPVEEEIIKLNGGSQEFLLIEILQSSEKGIG